MSNLSDILKIIAKHVQKHLGEKTLNELIAQGIAVYLEVMKLENLKVIPSSRSIGKPTADPEIVIGVIEELAELEA